MPGDTLGGGIHRTDVNVVAKWSKKESDRLQDRFKIMRKEARAGRGKGREFNAFHEELNRILDKNGGRYRHKGRILQETPLQIARKVDMVVSAGLNWMAQLGTGETTTSFRYQQAGDGTTAESSGQTALVNRLTSVDLDTVGTRFDSGNDMKFAGFYDESHPSGTYAEFANATASSGGTILNRTLLAAPDRIVFVTAEDVMTFNSIILGTGS